MELREAMVAWRDSYAVVANAGAAMIAPMA